MFKAFGLLGGLFLMSPWALALTLEYLSDQSFATGHKYEKSEFGGISALAWDRATPPRLWALSDDRGAKGEPRLYRLKVEVSTKNKPQISLQPDRVLYLRTKKGESFVKGAIDPESLIFLSDGSFIIGSEGDNNLKPRVAPQLLHFTAEGKLQAEAPPVPEHYIPEASGYSKKGIRNNAGFEAMALAPSGDFFLLGAELPLVQDGPSPNFELGGRSRILKFVKDKNQFVARQEWAYPLEPVESQGPGSMSFINGLTEALILDPNTALVIERAAIVRYTEFLNTVRIFKVDLSSGTDTLKWPSLKDKQLQPLKKSLILDLAKIRDKFSTPKLIDNVEAIAWGPKLPTGEKTLILASDNNFNKTQRSHFIFLILKP